MKEFGVGSEREDEMQESVRETVAFTSEDNKVEKSFEFGVNGEDNHIMKKMTIFNQQPISFWIMSYIFSAILAMILAISKYSEIEGFVIYLNALSHGYRLLEEEVHYNINTIAYIASTFVLFPFVCLLLGDIAVKFLKKGSVVYKILYPHFNIRDYSGRKPFIFHPEFLAKYCIYGFLWQYTLIFGTIGLIVQFIKVRRVNKCSF